MKLTIPFYCNNCYEELHINPAKPLLDVIREDLRLTGTKEGCKEGDCGACTVLVGELIPLKTGKKIIYRNINSCLYPVGDIFGKHLVTIEGLKQKSPSKIQSLFLEKGASQCGFCTPGFIISFTAFLLSDFPKDYANLINVISGNICRCTGNISINDVALEFSDWFKTNTSDIEHDIQGLVNLELIPEYFLSIEDKLNELDLLLTSKKEIHQSGIENQFQKENYYLISGGTDLYVQKADDLQLSGIHSLERDPYAQSRYFGNGNTKKNIRAENEIIFITGNSTISDIEESELIKKLIPSLGDWLKLFGSKPVRNRATVAGNIRNASPIADLVNILLAFDASLLLKSSDTERKIPLDSFYRGYKNVDIAKDEIISEVFFRIPEAYSLMNYEKISKRMYLDIASVNSTFLLEVENDVVAECRISAGGVAPVPLLLIKTSDFLKGKIIKAETVKKAAQIAQSEISPISDARGTKEYKSLLLRQIIFAHFIKLFPEKIHHGDLL